MSYVYVNEQGSQISVDGGYCVIVVPNGLKRLIPIETIEYVSVFGNVHITTPALQMFMKNNITVTLYSQTGGYFGRIMSNENVNINRQRKQFRLSGNTEFSLKLSKKILKAKIHNQAVVLSRYCPKTDSNENIKASINQIKITAKSIDRCVSIEQLMGYEGIAAKYYFQGLSKCVSPGFKFSGRSRRPPKDEFNSMLSLGYSLLMNELYGAAEGKGLNVYAGFLHQDRERHPTLASDLMEEWRSVIVDSVVLSLVNGHEVHTEGFTKSDDGIFLNSETFKVFIRKYENKLNTYNSYLDYEEHSGLRISFRRALWFQTAMLAKAIDNEDSSLYKPVYIR
ncbi:MAG: CRISPR-associated endonuclease Cas1 [Clostridiales bacterium]|nr:CRISPR-associated endonuclease Cas1 [Clostridiales bacterium]